MAGGIRWGSMTIPHLDLKPRPRPGLLSREPGFLESSSGLIEGRFRVGGSRAYKRHKWGPLRRPMRDSAGLAGLIRLLWRSSFGTLGLLS